MNELNYASLEASKRLVEVGIVLETEKVWVIVTGKQIGRASCRERVYVLV